MKLSNTSFWCCKCNNYVLAENLERVKELFDNKKVLQQLYSEISLLDSHKEEEKEVLEMQKDSTEVKSVEDSVGLVYDKVFINERKLSENFSSLFSDTEELDEDAKELANIEISLDSNIEAESEGGDIQYTKDPVLEQAEKEALMKRLIAGEFKKIAVLTGAGISVNAGIPDFRTPGTGLYSQLAKYNLPYPEAVFTLSYFAANPKPFYQLAQEMFCKKYLPTVTHYFIRFLQEKGLLLRNYTQNIDNLEVEAGVNRDLLRQVHGTFINGHCISCRTEVSEEEIMQAMSKGMPKYCEFCGSPCKPDIVFFNEGLPQETFYTIDELKTECDLLIVMGSSLTVLPFCAFPLFPPKHIPRLIINNEFPKIFGRVEGLSYVFMKGDCDTVIKELVDTLGWSAEFSELLKAREEYKKQFNL
eukprot:TRINITY_DN10190_c0_g8_i1.p1 TRINITY_DN10190_c0_g8~~TRINITY_DN10190_c0_g8_i1.p1  ORF type:complete len:416 (-),score=113.49 TRINITY_DN10190_c0_g8_i1:45-1292(-)